MPKQKKKFHFIQDWGTYQNQTLVCVGMSHPEMTRLMKRLEVDKKFMAKFIKDKERLERTWMSGDNDAFIFMEDGKTLLWFKDWKNNWKHYDTLVHEVYHLIEMIMFGYKNMVNDAEGCAYQSEFLFREIRRGLHKGVRKK